MYVCMYVCMYVPQVVVVWDENFCASGDSLFSTGIQRKDGSVVPVMTWDALLKSGNDDAAAGEELKQRIALIQPGSTCAYIYTSGTTGQPKAVMMTHDNVIFEARSCDNSLNIFGNDGEERIISYLPLSHVAGMLVDIIFPIVLTAFHSGWMSANFARPYDLKLLKIVERIKVVRPTLFLGVPRVWEKFAEKMAEIGAKIKAGGGLKPKISAWAKSTMLYHARASRLGGSGGTCSWFHWVAAHLLSKAKAGLGLDQMKFAMTGAAPIKLETLQYFGSIGIFINEVYGMSECAGACTISTDHAHVWGSCGYPMPGVEVKIFKEGGKGGVLVECPRAPNTSKSTEEMQGEICFRGRNNMAGYMANPDMGAAHIKEIEKKNVSAIDENGWLHSGDKGCMGVDGFVKITGRYKELIITAGGENIAPVPVEDSVKGNCKAISNIVMVGDKRKFNSAMITLKAYGTGEEPGGVQLESAAQNFGCKTIGDAMRSKEYTDILKAAIVKTNNNGDVCPSNASKIQKFTILPRDFSVATGELTATLKTKRSVVSKINAEAIDRMYSSKVPHTQAFVPFADPLPVDA
jgi:long-chain-fatty-acid--CoA ligase ACSBG